MELKNWTLSAFQPGKQLFENGFSHIDATAVLHLREKKVTPDLLVWGRDTLLCFECKSGQLDPEEHLESVSRYPNLPEEVVFSVTGDKDLRPEGVLVYLDQNLRRDKERTEELKNKLVLHQGVVIWNCVKKLRMQRYAGDHRDDLLNTITKVGIPLALFPPVSIQLQPDSPTRLLAHRIFRGLWDRLSMFRRTIFDVGDVREILGDQNYGHDGVERRRKIRKAIELGKQRRLCDEEETGKSWRLNVVWSRTRSIEHFLRRLTGLLTSVELEDYL